MTTTSNLTYAQAINAALHQAMELDDKVFVYGIGADGKSGIFGTTGGLSQRFGNKRIFDIPISEQAQTGLALGAANAGLRPILVHQRLDFMLISMDQIGNWIAPWRFMSGGRARMPLTIRAIVGKGWGQGPQHSKSLHAWFAHIPGLRVVMPATPVDAKGLLLSSIFSDDPVIFIEGRSLYSMEEQVPDNPYFIELGKAAIRRPGSDVTLVTFGSMLPIALQATARLSDDNISVELVDLRCLAPLDIETVVKSVQRTGRLVVAEPGFRHFGAAAEIITSVVERVGPALKERPIRVTWPHSFVPTSAPLEAAYYPSVDMVAQACRTACGLAGNKADGTA